MSMEPHHVVKCPIITEESQIQTGKANQYTFRVNPRANKKQIREALEAIFPNVRVIRVNTMNYQGKMRRQFVSRTAGRKGSWKKAIVTLRDGDHIELI
ncbi:MAG: 50S ribosomal protein L23 [Candidatus Hydrogenedentes bacterium]|nr:50S ribosomal protein L23 [Candidatus Hydrogenedentota bacterium]